MGLTIEMLEWSELICQTEYRRLEEQWALPPVEPRAFWFRVRAWVRRRGFFLPL